MSNNASFTPPSLLLSTIGLSTQVDVNLHDQSGPVLAQQPPQKASFSTNVYDRQLAEADAMITQLIHDNSAAVSKTAQR